MGSSATVAVSVSAVTTVLRGSALAVRLLTSDRGGQRLWVGSVADSTGHFGAGDFSPRPPPSQAPAYGQADPPPKILVLGPEELEGKRPIIVLQLATRSSAIAIGSDRRETPSRESVSSAETMSANQNGNDTRSQ